MPDSLKIREQLQETLGAFGPLRGTRPFKGWIRSIREALGMSGRQLASRVQVETSRISEMEKAEVKGNITLRTLRRAAEAMGCELVYALVPKTDLAAIMRAQAEKAAARRFKSVTHTMALEEQALSMQDDAKMRARKAREWIEDPPRWLWDDE
jgi:predicted DNA-binding mobile mystery protein A